MKFLILCTLMSIAAGAPVILEEHVGQPATYPAVAASPLVKYATAPMTMSPVLQYLHHPSPFVKYAAPAATSYATVSQVHVAHPPSMAYHPYAAPLTAPGFPYPNYLPAAAPAVVKVAPHFAPW